MSSSDKSGNLKIAVVDDSRDDHFFVKTALAGRQQFQIFDFYSGDEFILYMKENFSHNEKVPDLVLLDINMPKLNGFETLEQLIQHDLVRSTRFVILSTDIVERDLKRCRALNIDCYKKPHSITDLEPLLMKIVSSYFPSAGA